MKPQRDIKKLKFVMTFIVMALAFYPAFELTRCIIQYNLPEGASWYFLNSYFELFMVWFWYLLIPVAVFKLVGLAYRMGKKAG